VRRSITHLRILRNFAKIHRSSGVGQHRALIVLLIRGRRANLDFECELFVGC
jgi:hypothetical protein